VAHKVAAEEGAVLARDVFQYAQKVVLDARDRYQEGTLDLDPGQLVRLNQYLAEMHLDPVEGPDETRGQDLADIRQVWGR